MTTAMSLGIAAAAVVVVGAAALGEKLVSREAQKERITVVYWEKWTDKEGEAMRDVVNAFNASQNRIFVKYLSISAVNNKTLLATAGGDPPDVAGLWQEQVVQFADANALTDLTEMAREAGLTEDYYIHGYWDPLYYNGRLWALPSTPASIALHVRKDLVPPEVASPETFPKTIEDFDKLVDRISTKNSDGSMKMGGFLPSNPGWWHWSWGGLFGGKLVDGDRITVNSPENVRAFEWIDRYGKRFGSKEMQDFQGGFGNFASPQDPFMVGKVATEINGVWKASYIKIYSKNDVPWFAVPFPYPKDRPELEGHSILSQDILCIPRGAKHIKEAFEFVRFVQRQDVMEGLCADHGKNSPLQKVSEGFFKTHKNPFIRLFDKLARSPKAINPPKIGILGQISAEMTVVFQQIQTGERTPKQALDEAQARLEDQWKVYQTQVLGAKN